MEINWVPKTISLIIGILILIMSVSFLFPILFHIAETINNPTLQENVSDEISKEKNGDGYFTLIIIFIPIITGLIYFIFNIFKRSDY